MKITEHLSVDLAVGLFGRRWPGDYSNERKWKHFLRREKSVRWRVFGARWAENSTHWLSSAKISSRNSISARRESIASKRSTQKSTRHSVYVLFAKRGRFMSWKKPTRVKMQSLRQKRAVFA